MEESLEDNLKNDFLFDIIKMEAKEMYEELKRNRLEVILVPAPDPKHTGHMIRAVDGQNPSWYQKIFGQDESIKRQHSLKALKRISSGDVNLSFKYHRLYLNLIMDRLREEP